MAEAAENQYWSDLLGLVARLHDREVDKDLLAALRGAELDRVLRVLPEPEDAEGGISAFLAALDDLGTDPDRATLDELAADFADIYLTHGYRASPNGSVWMTEDHLERQVPMFEIRDWYNHYGIEVPNWRIRSDDNIVHVLQFAQHVVGLGTENALSDAAIFLDRHLLPWVPDFCRMIEERSRTVFHRSAARMTRTVLALLRSWLQAQTGIAPEIVLNAFAAEKGRSARALTAHEAAPTFVPGLSESW